jgi:Flp pilus assembly protein TadB
MTPDFYGSIIQYDLTKWGLGLAAAWMLGGNIVMYKMCNFRI